MEDHNPDPVHCENGQWWFYDEVWCDRYGPYETEEIARKHLEEYVRTVLGG